jgi:hypothetical protein
LFKIAGHSPTAPHGALQWAPEPLTIELHLGLNKNLALPIAGNLNFAKSNKYKTYNHE